MAINSKYNMEEQKIAREIWRLNSLQNNRRKVWLETDVKIVALKGQLNGKYLERK